MTRPPVFKTGAFNRSATHPYFAFVSFSGFSLGSEMSSATGLPPNGLRGRLYRPPDRGVNLLGRVLLHLGWSKARFGWIAELADYAWTYAREHDHAETPGNSGLAGRSEHLRAVPARSVN